MAKRQREPIKVESYVTINGRECNLDEMTPDQKSFIGAHLKARYLNVIFAGQAVFSTEGLPDVREVFPELWKAGG